MSSDKETAEARYYGMEIGVCTSVADPKGLGRIQLRVPGVCEPGPWAFPIGTRGGGAAQRGDFSVPPEGAEVAVFFHRGDPHYPYYLSGHWGSPDAGGDEIPTDAKAADIADRPDVHTYETKRWVITCDDREGKEQLQLYDKQLENLFVQLDGKTGAAVISGEALVRIRAVGLVDIDGGQVQIAGRVVMGNGKPIQ